MTRRTSDSRSRHKPKKDMSLSNKRAMRNKRDEEIENSDHDPKSPRHPANCECIRLHPGLFLPESLKQQNKDTLYYNTYNNDDIDDDYEDDDDINGKA